MARGSISNRHGPRNPRAAKARAVNRSRTDAGEATVAPVARCDLRVTDGSWSFSARNGPAIAAHWAKRRAENPLLFDGVIHVMARHALADGVFGGVFQRTDFKSYLYWRDAGFPSPAPPEPSPRDCFGSALIRSAEGHVLLGRQRAGNLNGGLAYPPGGFIDARDIRGDGSIDIDASIWREIGEETGLGEAELSRVPGYRAVFAGPLAAIAAEYRSPLPLEDLRRRVLAHIAGEPDSELACAVIVREAADIEPATPEYAKALLRAVLSRSLRRP